MKMKIIEGTPKELFEFEKLKEEKEIDEMIEEVKKTKPRVWNKLQESLIEFQKEEKEKLKLAKETKEKEQQKEQLVQLPPKRVRPKNLGKKWTREEQSKIFHSWVNGISKKNLAEAYGRTLASVNTMLVNQYGTSNDRQRKIIKKRMGL